MDNDKTEKDERRAARVGGVESRSGILPVYDTEFLMRPEMRTIRFALEYSKADLLLRDWGIRSTIIVFGSARCLSPELAQTPPAGLSPEKIKRQLGWYEAARLFGQIASLRGGAFAPRNRWRDNVIATGGGPGLMEAANRGANDVGAPSIGFNIALPREQKPNVYVTPELTFQFHYFAMRKMHLAMRANGLVAFPGGFGTLDELFEMLTLQQTGKTARAPVVLFDREYWRGIINFDRLVEEDMISPQDLELFSFADTAEEAWETLVSRGLKAHAPDDGLLDDA
jgi:uncharacterized protein (TIGR00730 family)